MTVLDCEDHVNLTLGKWTRLRDVDVSNCKQNKFNEKDIINIHGEIEFVIIKLLY